MQQRGSEIEEEGRPPQKLLLNHHYHKQLMHDFEELSEIVSEPSTWRVKGGNTYPLVCISCCSSKTPFLGSAYRSAVI